jgi:hypothetical protein
MRFEGKHKEFKEAAKGKGFRNILKTLSEHHQRLMAFEQHYNPSFGTVTMTTGTGM